MKSVLLFYFLFPYEANFHFIMQKKSILCNGMYFGSVSLPMKYYRRTEQKKVCGVFHIWKLLCEMVFMFHFFFALPPLILPFFICYYHILNTEYVCLSVHTTYINKVVVCCWRNAYLLRRNVRQKEFNEEWIIATHRRHTLMTHWLNFDEEWIA